MTQKLNCRLCKSVLQNDFISLAKLRFKISRTGAGDQQTECQQGVWISDLSRIPEVLDQVELWHAGVNTNGTGKQVLRGTAQNMSRRTDSDQVDV
jgi:hypothetical protein